MISKNVYFQIELTARKIRSYGQSILKKHGIDITVEQWLVLNVIGDNEAISQVGIGQELLKDKPTISKMVNQLVAKEYVYKQVCKTDTRQVELVLTSKGDKLIKELFPIIEEVRLKGLKELSDVEKENLQKVLLKIQKNLWQ